MEKIKGDSSKMFGGGWVRPTYIRKCKIREVKNFVGLLRAPKGIPIFGDRTLDIRSEHEYGPTREVGQYSASLAYWWEHNMATL